MSKDADDRDEQVRAMFAAIGGAMTAWARIEEGLTQVFSGCLTPSLTLANGMHFGDVSGPAAVFYAVENLRARLSMIEAALKRGLPDGDETTHIVKLWGQVASGIKGPIKSRNRLAHWHVQVAELHDRSEARLVPPFFDIQRTHEGLRLHDITVLTDTFIKFADEKIRPVYMALGKHLGLRAAHASHYAAMQHNMRVGGEHGAADDLRAWLIRN